MSYSFKLGTCGLNEKCPRRLLYLDIWFLLVELFRRFGSLEDVELLEVNHSGGALRLYGPASPPVLAYHGSHGRKVRTKYEEVE